MYLRDFQHFIIIFFYFLTYCNKLVNRWATKCSNPEHLGGNVHHHATVQLRFPSFDFYNIGQKTIRFIRRLDSLYLSRETGFLMYYVILFRKSQLQYIPLVLISILIIVQFSDHLLGTQTQPSPTKGGGRMILFIIYLLSLFHFPSLFWLGSNMSQYICKKNPIQSIVCI